MIKDKLTMVMMQCSVKNIQYYYSCDLVSSFDILEKETFLVNYVEIYSYILQIPIKLYKLNVLYILSISFKSAFVAKQYLQKCVVNIDFNPRKQSIINFHVSTQM